MLWIGIGVYLAFFLLWLRSKKYNTEYFKQLDKKEDPLLVLYPLLFYIKTMVSKVSLNKVKKQKKRIFEELYLGKAEEMEGLFFYRKASMMIAVCLVALFLSMVVEISTKNVDFIENQLPRPSLGTGETSVLIAYESENGFTGDINIKVSEKQLSDESVDALFEEAKLFIDREILDRNISTNEVTSDLNLMTSIPNMSISIKWSVSDSTYVNRQGNLYNEDMSEEALVEISATMTYYEHQVIYSQWIRILPKNYSGQEMFDKTLQETLIHIDEATRKEEFLQLPKKVDDYTLKWNFKEQESAMYLLLLGIVASICIMISMESSLKNKQKLRNLQMLIDYPEIISKFTLLLNAGMTIRAAFERIASDYLKKRSRDSKNLKKEKEGVRYAYEELVLVVRELELGRPEAVVYDAFGQRCSLMCYLRFSTIIVQNMRKGTKGIVPMLELEALDAFAERKETAKRLGEEAGTKLLGPMIGMLFIVLLIVLVPAFLNFSF